MRRREFMTLLCTTAGMLCLILSRAQPQSSKTYRIGYLALAKIPHLIEALQDGLRKFGYVEGENLKTEYRVLQGGSATLDALAAELVRLSPDLIVTVGTPPAARAARRRPFLHRRRSAPGFSVKRRCAAQDGVTVPGHSLAPSAGEADVDD